MNTSVDCGRDIPELSQFTENTSENVGPALNKWGMLTKFRVSVPRLERTFEDFLQ
jgi:hypothetical protein